MNDRALSSRVEEWFTRRARPLPWRTAPRDPWASLVSETMLQQTQVARVLEKFSPFMRRFPTPGALASADEDTVLAYWQGLGYYRRARHLRDAAIEIVRDHAGRVPSDTDALRALKGVGRYTAGAIASIVFGHAEPIVDGNVLRLLARLEGAPVRTGDPAALNWAWERAGALVTQSADPAALNEGLMELGATVCTPRAPRCDACPLAAGCAARASGTPEAYPLPKARSPVQDLFHATVLVRDRAGRVLLEKRPDRGLWAGLWQPIGLDADTAHPTRAQLCQNLGVEHPAPIASMTHQTSHRRVQLRVWTASAAALPAGSAWVAPAALGRFALSNPHRRITRAGLGAPLTDISAG